MSSIEAVTKAAQLTAAACADVLGTLVAAPGSFSDVTVEEAPEDPWKALEFPLVAVRIAFTEGITGEDLFVLVPDQARRLAAAMMGSSESESEGDLNEIELSAVSEAMNQMMGAVATAMADAIGRPTDIATPQTSVLESGEAAESLCDARYVARFTLNAGALSATIVQLVPEDFALVLHGAFNSAAAAEAVLGGEHQAKLDRLNDDTYAAVERTARIAAESSADVLSTLLGGKVAVTLPEVEAHPEDPLADLTYPVVTVEVSYVSGVTGANLFALTPPQSAMLAAVMMGRDEPSGDGLSELELSAVSEAMNQMMGAATNILADTLSLDIEVAPPICQVMESVEQARATFEHPAYCSKFRIVSDRLTADVVQLVPADFALHLQEAFGAADLGRSIGREPHAASAATTASTNAAAARTAAGALGFDSFRSVKVRVSAELGRSQLEVARVMNLPPGSIVELDRTPTDPIDILVNGRPFAKARLVLVDGEYAAQIVSLERPKLHAR